MHHEQWHWVGALAFVVDKMNTQPIDVRSKVLVLVERLFLRTPVVFVELVGNEVFHVLEINSAIPAALGNFLWPTGAFQSLTKVV